MEKNIAIIDIEKYDKLKTFKYEIEKGMVGIQRNEWNTFYYVTEDDFHKEMVTMVNEFRDKTIEQEKEILNLKKERKLNLMQRIFNY